MLDDEDTFKRDDAAAFLTWVCPSCGGFREDGCSECANYILVFSKVESEPEWFHETIPTIHVETLRRIESSKH